MARNVLVRGTVRPVEAKAKAEKISQEALVVSASVAKATPSLTAAMERATATPWNARSHEAKIKMKKRSEDPNQKSRCQCEPFRQQ